jgi:hypothetical protein
MKIKFYISKCKGTLLAEYQGCLYPFVMNDANVLGQCFKLTRQFYDDGSGFISGDKYQTGRLILSATIPDKIRQRLSHGGL